MKLIVAIVNNDDAPTVSAKITKAGFNVTKMASTGGFLLSGNTTFISGVEDEKVDDVIEIIKNYSKRRTQAVPLDFSYTPVAVGSFPMQVTVGGATIFVLDVERFERA